MHERIGRITGIIGGTSEVGKQIATQLLKEGSGVVILDTKLDNTVAELAGRPRVEGERVGHILFVEVDINNPKTITDACDRAKNHFGEPINAFVNLTPAELKLPVPNPDLKSTK